MYSEQTYEAIKKRIVDNTKIDVDKREGSFIDSMISPMAVELAKTYMEFGNILNIVFLKDTYEDYLDLKCMEFGIIRKEGLKSKGYVTFLGEENNIIPVGVQVATEGEIIFETREESIIKNGQAKVLVEALEVGIKYNVSKNQIVKIVTEIVGINAVDNDEDFSGGIDKENDELLKERLFSKVRKPSISGNIQHYKEWALSIDGVEKVDVISLWDGPGTVKVIIAAKDNTPVDYRTIEMCRNYINEVKPIGALVTVVTTNIFELNITCNISLNGNYSVDLVKLAITEELNKYFTKCTNTVIYTKVGAIISNIEGIVDYTNLKLNNKTNNISINRDDSVKVNELSLILE